MHTVNMLQAKSSLSRLVEDIEMGRLGKGGMPVSGSHALIYFRESGYRLLPIEAEHAVAAETLPPHHQDPFDRLLVAQALVEPMRLVTHDAVVALYSDTIIKI